MPIGNAKGCVSGLGIILHVLAPWIVGVIGSFLSKYGCHKPIVAVVAQKSALQVLLDAVENELGNLVRFQRSG